MKMSIISPGALTTVQDAGRFGYMQSGFSPSGAMDRKAMRIANILVANHPDEAVLEMTVSGISAKFDCNCVAAICGADMGAQLDGEEMPMYQAVQIKKGSTLTMKSAKTGMRAYLAVFGGFDLPLVMGSLSTNLKCAAGGFEGRKLKAGDEIPLRQSATLALTGNRKYKETEKYTPQITLRVILGPQDSYFTEKGLDTFFNAVYTVTDKSDRMGIRLDGEKIESKNGVDIISDAIATGSVQVPNSGTPIIMTADRQTTGGYAKIATVITPDLSKIAQAKPGTKIRFSPVSIDEGRKIYKQEEKFFSLLEYSFLGER